MVLLNIIFWCLFYIYICHIPVSYVLEISCVAMSVSGLESELHRSEPMFSSALHHVEGLHAEHLKPIYMHTHVRIELYRWTLILFYFTNYVIAQEKEIFPSKSIAFQQLFSFCMQGGKTIYDNIKRKKITN